MQDILQNLLSPLVLCFILGLGAGLVKSDLQVPNSFVKGISIYLMLAIGLQGGAKLAHVGCASHVMMPILAGGLLSFLIPFLAFGMLKATTPLDNENSAAISAHYGSIGIITFIAAVEFLKASNIYAEEFMVAVAAVMETPAIIAGLILNHRHNNSGISPWTVLKGVFFHSSILLLLGGFVIGFLAGPSIDTVKPFFFDMFKGFLCIFLLDIGLLVASRASTIRTLDWRVFSFGLYMPIINACIGTFVGHSILHLSLGGTMVFASLCASSSYIAVPAAMRLAIPQANPAIYMALSLGITFPFNILSIPYYYKLAEFWAKF